MSQSNQVEGLSDRLSASSFNDNENVTNELPSTDLTSDHASLDSDGFSGFDLQSNSLSTGQHSSLPYIGPLDHNRVGPIYQQHNLNTTNNFVNYVNTGSTSFSGYSIPNGNIVGSSVPVYRNDYVQSRSNSVTPRSLQNGHINEERPTGQRFLVGANRYVTVSEYYEEPMDESVEPAKNEKMTNQLALRDERIRLQTFLGKWPDRTPPQINPSTLSKDGFYYIGPFDRVSCIFCKGILKKWDANDTVVGEHRKHFPRCPFVLGDAVGNIPLESSHMLKSDSFGVLPVQNMNKPLHESPSERAENLGIVQNKPKNPRFSLETDRLATFRNWPSQIKQQPEQMAQAGLFYVGSGDRVKCFTCDGLLTHWEPEDEPWIEHARWFPDCHFVRLVKGDKFIEQVLRGETPAEEKETKSNSEKEHEQNSAAIQALLEEGCKMQDVSEAIKLLHENGGVPDDVIPKAEQIFEVILEGEKIPNGKVMDEDLQDQRRNPNKNSKANEDLSALLEENRELKEQKICKICLDNEISIIFLPCGHLVCCGTCASSVTECPICRAAIKGAAKTFWS